MVRAEREKRVVGEAGGQGGSMAFLDSNSGNRWRMGEGGDPG